MTTRLEENAHIFAGAAHAAVGQVRKYTGDPYIVHPSRVRDTLVDAGITNPDVLASALLHDVVEDTHITLDLINTVFGKRVRDIVEALTDVPTVEGGPNRKARKAMDRARIALADADVHTIKAADLIDNTSSIVEFDPKFAKVYLAEKALLLEVLTKADPKLLARAKGE